MKGKLDEVVLDYFWFSDSYVNTNVRTGFYRVTLPYIASELLRNKGVIWLPLIAGTFCGFFENKDLIQKSGLRIKLVSDLSEMNLFAASGMFDSDFILHYFGKVENQHNCLGIQAVKEFDMHTATWKSEEKRELVRLYKKMNDDCGGSSTFL